MFKLFFVSRPVRLLLVLVCLILPACSPVATTVAPVVVTLPPTLTPWPTQPPAAPEIPSPPTPTQDPRLNDLIAICKNPAPGGSATIRLQLAPASVFVLLHHNDAWSSELYTSSAALLTNEPSGANYVLCVEQTDTLVGNYTDGQPGYRVNWDAKLIETATKNILYSNILQGSEPELLKTHIGAGYGTLPTEGLIGWLEQWKAQPVTARSPEKGLGESGDSCGGLTFSPDGKLLVTGGYNGKIQVWNLSSGGDPRVLEGHENEIYGVAISSDGKWLAVADRSDLLTVWDMTTFEQTKNRYVLDMPASLAISPDGSLAALGTVKGHIAVYDLSTGADLYTFGETDGFLNSYAVFSPDGKRLTGSLADNSLVTWDLVSGKVINQTTLDNPLSALALLNDGETLAMVTWDGRLMLRKLDGSIILDVQTGASFNKAAFSPDGKLLATGDSSGKIQLFDLQTGQPSDVFLKGLPGMITAMAFSPDGQTLAVCSFDYPTTFWNVQP